MAKPTQNDPQFKLRMTQRLKDALALSAHKNNRSLNAEILDRLEKSLSVGGDELEVMIRDATENAVIAVMFAFLEEGLLKISPGDHLKLTKEDLPRILETAKKTGTFG